MPHPLPTQSRLREVLDYNFITGELIWKANRNRHLIGKPAGWVNAYRYVTVDRVQYRANRLIWRWVTGQDPGSLIVDHWDDDPTNDAWHNLSLLTQSENMYKAKCGTARLPHPINAPFRCDG